MCYIAPPSTLCELALLHLCFRFSLCETKSALRALLRTTPSSFYATSFLQHSRMFSSLAPLAMSLLAFTSVVNAAPIIIREPDAAAIGNFGSCSVPQIEFGVGFDNRKETSFQPADEGKNDPL